VSAPSLPDRRFYALDLVQSPPALRTLARVLGGLLATLILALACAPWQQNVPGTGRVVAFEPFDRMQTLAAPVSGRVRQAWVIEGSYVEKGDRILEIVDNDPSILQRLEAQRTALDAQLEAARQKVSVFDSKIEALESARSMAIDAARSHVQVAVASSQSARFALQAARAAAQQADLNYKRQRELVDEGLTSQLDFELAERVHREAEARVEQALQALEAAQNDEQAERSNLGRVDTEARAAVESARTDRQSAEGEVAALQERVAELETRIAQQNTQLITAPRSGTIFRLHAAPGAELVKAGDPLVSLIPETSSRAVELWVDGNNVPLIDEGRPVRLQFEGWPAIQFAGWPSVAVGTFGGRVSLVDPGADERGRFRLLVVPDPSDTPWPEPRYLRQGVRANGFVLLDQVRLGYELWRQANDFPPTVAMSGDGGKEKAPHAGPSEGSYSR
jgi:adhesin transport system membrane fusion protein